MLLAGTRPYDLEAVKFRRSQAGGRVGGKRQAPGHLRRIAKLGPEARDAVPDVEVQDAVRDFVLSRGAVLASRELGVARDTRIRIERGLAVNRATLVRVKAALAGAK